MELASLMHEMIQFSFDSNKLPDSMTEANICVFLKKGKCPEECGSYRSSLGSYPLTITQPKQDEKNSLSGHGLG